MPALPVRASGPVPSSRLGCGGAGSLAFESTSRARSFAGAGACCSAGWELRLAVPVEPVCVWCAPGGCSAVLCSIGCGTTRPDDRTRPAYHAASTVLRPAPEAALFSTASGLGLAARPSCSSGCPSISFCEMSSIARR